MPTIGDVRTKLTAQTQPFVSGMKRARSANTRFRASLWSSGRAATSVSTNFKGLVAGLLGFVAAARALRSVVNTFLDFQTRMNNVRAITNATGEDFGRLTAQAKDLGRTTQFTAVQAAEGMEFLSRTGLSVNQTIAAMPGVLNLAAATATEFATSADIVTNVLKGMGLGVDQLNRLVDVLAFTAASSNTNLQQLGEAMKKVGPNAASAGESVETMAAAVGVLGDAGLQGEEAGTALRRILINLETGAGVAGTAIKRLGLQTHDAQGNFVGIRNVIEQLEGRVLTAKDKFQLFGARALAAGNILLRKGSRAFDEFRESIEASGGTADRMRRQQMAGLVGAMKLLKSAIEGAKIAIGEAFEPELRRTAQRLTTLISKIAENETRLRAWAQVVIQAGKTFVSVFAGLIRVAFNFGQIIGNILGGVGDILIGIVTLDLDKVKEGFARAAEAIKGDIEDIVSAVKNVADNFVLLTEASTIAWNAVTDDVRTAADSVTDDAARIAQLMEDTGANLNDLSHILGDEIPKAAQRSTRSLSPMFRGVQRETETLADTMRDVGVQAGQQFTGGVTSALLEGSRDIISVLRNIFKSAIQSAISQITGGFLSGLFKKAGGFLTGTPIGGAIAAGAGVAAGIIGGDVIDPAPAGVSAEPGGGGIVIDMSRLPPPRNPLEAARDPIVVGFIAEALRTAQERGFRLR